VQAMRDLLPASRMGAAVFSFGRHWRVREAVLPASLRPYLESQPLPIWATEVGIKTVTPDTWADPQRRQRQADWILSTARQALAHPQVAVFMPFVLVHKNDPYALTEAADRPWPAWTEYSRFTRENAFPPRPALREPVPVNPVVLQWLADPATASGHKLAAAYRWRADGKPIQGELRIYNFDSKSVRGRLVQTRQRGDGTASGSAGAIVHEVPSGAYAGELMIPAGGYLALPLSFVLADAPDGGSREWRQFVFVDELGRRSELGFALERSPDLFPASTKPLTFVEWGSESPRWSFFPHAIPSGGDALWRTANGVQVLFSRGGLARFQLGERPFDPEFPPIAAAKVSGGLPDLGWIRVAVRELGPVGVRVRVDLVDEEGRRFTQWENMGEVRGLPANAPRWLNLLDFHPYAWGKLDKQRRLIPAKVREIQLRFYAPKGPTMVDVELGLSDAYGHALDLAGEVRALSTEGESVAPVD